MGRRSFGRRRTRRNEGASSSRKSLECPRCHAHIPLNEYKVHISNCQEKTSNDKSKAENGESSKNKTMKNGN